MVEARVERDGFVHEGRKRSIDSIVIVSDALWRLYGSSGTAILSFIRSRPDRVNPPGDGIVASKKARALANENRVDISEIEGTGANGSVRVPDVERFIRARNTPIE